MADLNHLITPIFLGLSNYWQLAKLGEEVTADKFRSDMETYLDRAREASRGDADLARAFERVHHPLIFFIDYLVKEGPFAFKDEWRLMARDFNELSGDEKFFEVLEEVLRYSDNPETLQPFYLMLGLGFDGIHHRDPEKIHAYIKLLSEKLKPGFDHRSEYLTRFPVRKRVTAKRQTLFGKYKLLAITGGLAAAALLVNITFFFIATADFRGAVTSAASSAMVFSTGNATTNANLPPIPWEAPTQTQTVLPVPPDALNGAAAPEPVPLPAAATPPAPVVPAAPPPAPVPPSPVAPPPPPPSVPSPQVLPSAFAPEVSNAD